MKENELADLLIRMAVDRGVDIEAAAEELASFALPSFVDARAFRSAVILVLETNLRAQVEERLQSIRRRFDVGAQAQRSPQSRPATVQPVPTPEIDVPRPAMSMDGLTEVADATMTDLSQVTGAETSEPVESEELPTDATMIWTTRHG